MEIVRALIGAGAEVDAPAKYGVTALWVAASLGNPEVVRQLLASGARTDAAAMVDNEAVTPLQIARRGGHREVVGILEAASEGGVRGAGP